jgi:LPS-assembly lipoprotein
LLGLISAALLSACGFELRRPVDLPYRRVALTGFAPHSPLAEALRQALPADTRIVESPAQAEAVIAVSEDVLHSSVAASTSAGQVREFRLRVSLRFRLLGTGGVELLPDTELEQERDISYTETAALAKQTEQAALLREMRADLAQQILRVLAASARASRAANSAASAPSAEASAAAAVDASRPR